MRQGLTARGTRAAVGCWLIAVVCLAACSGGNNNRNINSSVGTSTGVSLTSSTGSASLVAGATITLTATITNDTNSGGVTWVLTGDGSLANITKTTADYTAPTAVTGTITPVVTATAVADTTQNASATLLVSGTPVIAAVPLFPATAASAYAASVTADGGTGPFVWTVSSGTLPNGLALAGNTGGFETISGTPTDAGTSSFTMTTTDANGNVASVNLTLVVQPAASCLLSGQYAMLVTGGNAQFATRVGSINISSAAAITGSDDRKQGTTTVAAENWTGTCTNRASNSGQLALVGTNDSPNYNFSVTTSLQQARLQLTSGGDASSGTGPLYQQNPPDFNLASLAGSFAFGLLGAEPSERRLGLVGQLSIDATGTVTAGRLDSNASSPLNSATVTGTMSAPDSNGRGTLNLAGGGQSFSFAYYVVNASKLLLVNVDSSATAPRLAGFMTRRATNFNGASMTGASVLSLWGASGTIQPIAVLSVGLISGASASTGTFNLLLDTADHANILPTVSASATSYSVEADGRVTLNFTTSGSVRQLVGYLDAGSNGYVVERNSSSGNAGLLEAQSAGPFTNTVPGLFVSGTQYPQSSAPLALLPVVYLSSGTVSASSATGYVSIDPTVGHGIGTLTITGLGGTAMGLYVVNPSKLVVLRFGSSSQNGAIEWMVSN